MSYAPAAPLNLLKAPLEGTHLIEASAGTGKTYTIAGLYLRLILEAGVSVDRILVVTYTRAATAELRDRIRRRLVEAREALAAGDTRDSLLRELLDLQPDRDTAGARLRTALNNFDEAAVFTIHGFCQRVLGDQAFECAMPFETELMPDENELLLEVCEDFWRTRFYDASSLWLDFALANKLSPEGLLRELKPHHGKGFQQLEGGEAPPDPTPLEAAYGEAYLALRDGWRNAGAEVTELLMGHPGLKQTSYKPGRIAGWFEQLTAFLALADPHLGLFTEFRRLTTRSLVDAPKKGFEAPRHAFFETCDRFLEAHDALLAGYGFKLAFYRRELLEYLDQEAGRRKAERRVQSYNDLLHNLSRALEGPDGEALARTLRRRYGAALIDEFQDTDPVQYRVFRRIYRGSGLPVYLVGDPKQAIYSFRGADVFAYLEGRRDADGAHTLGTNWRSDPALIAALNAIFQASDRPFLLPDIPFEPVAPADREYAAVHFPGEGDAPLRIWWLGPDEKGKVLGKGVATPLIADAVAAAIGRLLRPGGATLDGRPMRGSDIAVLVRSHAEGRGVRESLGRLGIPCVESSNESVFHTQEAMDLERLLVAVAEPRREPLLRAALSTSLGGVTGVDLVRLQGDERDWESWLECFGQWHDLWRRRGFMRMFRDLSETLEVPERLLSRPGGERAMTNLLHLGELLMAAEVRHPGPEALIKWLAERREASGADTDEAELRLESDEQLVRVVTMHKSKGLEYPVVFCPFLWDGGLKGGTTPPVAVHDPHRDQRASLFLGPEVPEWVAERSRWEELAENLRLAYVALTRARHRCYLVWGMINGWQTSPLAWLLHRQGEQLPTLDAWQQAMGKRNEKELLADLDALKGGGRVAVEALPRKTGSPLASPLEAATGLRARVFEGHIPEPRRVTSYTALAHGGGHGETPDYDALAGAPPAPRSEAPGRNAFGFPRGARPGECLHAILERVDFTHGRPALLPVAEKALSEFGLAGNWGEVVAEWLQRVLATPLDPNGQLCLAVVPTQRRLNELEFYFPLGGVDVPTLGRVLARHGLSEVAEGLGFAPVRGYLKGFIDLVFEWEGRYYLADYKSNWLGPGPADYGQEALSQAMVREGYHLQYLLYTLALHRFLAGRLPDYAYERHFGGVYYLFLRGMDPATGPARGVFYSRPTRELVGDLETCMAGAWP